MTTTTLATLTWPVEPCPVIAHVGPDSQVEHGMRSMASLIAEATADVPAMVAERGWRLVGPPRGWVVLPGSEAGLDTDAALRCVVEIETEVRSE